MVKTPKSKSSESTNALLVNAEKESKRDRTRLIVMCVGLALVVLAYFASNMQQDKLLQDQEAVVEQEAPFTETVAVKEFDLSSIDSEILDERPQDRVLLPSSVTLPFTNYVFGLNDAHFHALGVELLVPERRSSIQADPAAYRGKPYRLRGSLEEIKSRERPDGKTEYKGWLRDKSGAVSHFIVMKTPEELTLNGYVRLDGLFTKLYSREDHDGGWAEGPLFIGSQLVKSYPRISIEAITEEVLLDRLGRLKDDTALDSTGLDGPVLQAQWLLMDYMKTDAYKAIDWEKDAVELNNETMTAILKNGEEWRYRLAGSGAQDPRAKRDPVTGERPLLTEDLIPIPIRIPISKNMGTNSMDPGENPCRLDRITMGWLGNWTWTNQAGVIKFVMPGFRPDLLDWKGEAELVQGKALFLKNHNYESMDHGTHTAPLLLVTELEVFHPIEDPLVQNLLWGVLVLTLLLLALFPYLLMRDRRKSAELQKSLIRRKRERRRRLTAEQPQG